MRTARDRRISRAQMAAMMKVPFFGPGILKLPVEWSEAALWHGQPTAVTDGTRILIHPGFADKVPDECLPTILCHEVCHPLLGHTYRFPDNCDHEVANVAADHEVNLMLRDFSRDVMTQGLADPFPWHKPHEIQCDDRFTGMAAEKIYGILMAERAKGGKSRPDPKGKPGGQKGGSRAGAGSGACNGPGQFVPAKPGKATQQAQVAWQNTLINSVKVAQVRQGLVPGTLSRLVESLVSNRVPWPQLLRSWLREQCSDDWDFMSPAMEYDESGFILPSLHSERFGRVVFATDTSGSIDRDMLAKFQAEKQSCLDEMRPSGLLDIYCDARIQKASEYGVGDTIALDAPGGGGTDFRPVFNHVEKLDEVPKCLVYLTDLCGRFPENAPVYPVLWVTWTKDRQAPFGEVVYAGE
jgi:predicted metal-dependent peptidase